jgi:ankyrin repeat protein
MVEVYKVDTKVKDKFGKNALMFACANKNPKIIQYLLTATDLEVDAADTEGMTPLMIASQENKIDIVKILLTKKQNLDAQIKLDGMSALMMASEKGNFEIIELLLQKGASKDLKNKSQKTALNLLPKLYEEENSEKFKKLKEIQILLK